MAGDGIFNIGLKDSIEARAGELLNGQGIDITSSGTLNHSTVYTTETEGKTDGPGGGWLNIKGTDSLFNPFRIFRYSKFGNSDGTRYNAGMHKFNYSQNPASEAYQSNLMEKTNSPMATEIIEWANRKAGDGSGPLYPYPYQINDFLWCKHYGKIPNNRLLTLRRYPMPVEDNLAIHPEKSPLIPISQAVTWWGGETENSLSKILGIEYGFKWKPLNPDVKNVHGNEIPAEALIDFLGLDKTASATIRNAFLALVANDPNNPVQSVSDEIYQKYDEDSYGENGPYWNRVLGPINVIDQTQIRDRGFDYNHAITLTFEYSLRSYSRINPKVAMLDLISNFLSLTYNNAQFWGGGIRYFKKTGYLLPGFNTTDLEKGNYIDGVSDLAKVMAQVGTDKVNDLKTLVASINTAIASGKSVDDVYKAFEESVKGTSYAGVADKLVGQRAKEAGLIQNVLMMRSFLDGRAVGEWHLMVGNPMNPIAVIGNLIMKTTSITLSDELGEDDFPTSIKFVVTLDHGRPRAKQDIESMFNSAGGDLSYTALYDNPSGGNSYGENTTDTLNRFNKSVASTQELAGASSANNLANYFKKNVARAYGENFGKSQVLTDYFLEVKTKD